MSQILTPEMMQKMTEATTSNGTMGIRQMQSEGTSSKGANFSHRVSFLQRQNTMIGKQSLSPALTKQKTQILSPLKRADDINTAGSESPLKSGLATSMISIGDFKKPQQAAAAAEQTPASGILSRAG